MESGGGHQVPSLAKGIDNCWEGEESMFTVCPDRPSTIYPRTYRKQKMSGINDDNTTLGGRGENMRKTHCMTFSEGVKTLF